MGLFTQRPERNEQWAGLPSEPVEPTPAEQLGDAALAVDALVIPDATAGVTSIEIPVPTVDSDGDAE